MVSRCDVSGHCGHWHSAGRADFPPVCCFCGEAHPTAHTTLWADADELAPTVRKRTTIETIYKDNASHESMTAKITDWEVAYARLGVQIDRLRKLRDERRAAKEAGTWPPSSDNATKAGES